MLKETLSALFVVLSHITFPSFFLRSCEFWELSLHPASNYLSKYYSIENLAGWSLFIQKKKKLSSMWWRSFIFLFSLSMFTKRSVPTLQQLFREKIIILWFLLVLRNYIYNPESDSEMLCFTLKERCVCVCYKTLQEQKLGMFCIVVPLIPWQEEVTTVSCLLP